MKKQISRAISFIICAVMVLSLAACGNQQQATVNVAELFKKVTVADQEKIENANYEMVWDNVNGCVIFTDKATGASWSTTPTDYFDVENKEARARNTLESAIIISYYDLLINEPAVVRAYTHSVKKGDISVEKSADTFKVSYYFENADIIVPIKYKLTEKGLSLTISADEIITGNAEINYIQFAPNLCSVKTGTEDSYLFYPSGSGAIIDTSDPAIVEGTYSSGIYGSDAASKKKEKLTNEKHAYLPVYGVKNGNNALMAVISSGEESMELVADAANKVTGYSSIYPTIYIRGYDYNLQKKVWNYSEEILYSDEATTGVDYTIDFYTLSGEAANYNGMAKLYQKLLYGNNDGTDIKEDTFSLKIYGGLMEDKDFIGFPYSKLLALTTYDDISNMLGELSSTDTTPNIQLFGFGTTGLDIGKVAGGFKFGSAFGSTKELNSLLTYCDQNGIDSFVNFDIISYRNSGNGFMKVFDTAQTANKMSAYQYYINKEAQTLEESDISRYRLLKRNKVTEAAEKLFKKLGKYSISGVSLSTVSDTAYSDYSSDAYYSKKGYAQQATDIINTYKEGGYSFAANGANKYAAVLADVIFEAPHTSSKMDIFTYDVPFYQMIFKGKAEITSEAVNQGEMLKKKQLMALETGSSMLFNVYQTYDSTVTFSYIKGLYSAEFDSVKQDIVAASEKYNDYYKAVSGQTIKNHTVLANSVRLTEFANGVKIYVNYSDKDFTVSDITVPAMDCVIIK